MSISLHFAALSTRLRSIIDRFASFHPLFVPRLWFQSSFCVFFCCHIDCIINWHVNLFSNMSRSPFNHKLFKLKKEKRKKKVRHILQQWRHVELSWTLECAVWNDFIYSSKSIHKFTGSSCAHRGIEQVLSHWLGFPTFHETSLLTVSKCSTLLRCRLSSVWQRHFVPVELELRSTTERESIGWHNDLVCRSAESEETHKSRRHHRMRTQEIKHEKA